MVKGIVVLSHDITERKQAEEKLKQANDYLENILENSPDAIGIVDRRGRFIKANSAAAELYGYHTNDLQGKDFVDLYPDRTGLDTMLAELRRLGHIKNYRIDLTGKDGSAYPLGAFHQPAQRRKRPKSRQRLYRPRPE